MKKAISIRGARQHNLKGIDLDIPHNLMVVITGVSGSGKSSLAFDTIFAEGQRRYMESLSAYARQFLEQMEKPEVESIEGLSPTIAIEQKALSKNPRSTVGTVTEIYDYLRLLFARLGTPYCYKCGQKISSTTVQEMTDTILSWPQGEKIILLAPVVREKKGAHQEVLRGIVRDGFVRVRVDGVITRVEHLEPLDPKRRHTIEVVVDRIKVAPKERVRVSDSLEIALRLSKGLVVVLREDGQEELFSQLYSCPTCNVGIPELSPRAFSFNSPYGACPRCTGLGFHKEIDPQLVVVPSLSLEEGAIIPWQNSDYYQQILKTVTDFYGIPMDKPWKTLKEKHREILLFGSREAITFAYRWKGRKRRFVAPFEGVVPHLTRRYLQSESEKVREGIEQYMRDVPCPQCKGTRLKPEMLSVKIEGRSIADVTAMSVEEALGFFKDLKFSGHKKAVGEKIVKEIVTRLGFLREVGLGYLSLNRTSATLSGGEGQRTRLATQIGSGLVGVTYVLDEPSIGLHPRDNQRLLNNLKRLASMGNTVIVVEHDRDTIEQADLVVDLGPGAGEEGGQLVAMGTPEEVKACKESLTGGYLSGRLSMPVRDSRREPKGYLKIKGARQHNLKGIDVAIPLGCFVCVTGVSGSGKSSLVVDTIYPALHSLLNKEPLPAGPFDSIEGLEHLHKAILIDQAPIGRTPRSNPATYTGLFTPIRELFAQLPLSRARGYRPGRFSFNVSGGRCETCKGEGAIKVEMHFLPDLYVPCEACKGSRYNRETLEVRYNGKNIAEVLNMTVDEALSFFENIPLLKRKLTTLAEVGLGYMRLGQPATTLSGGEAQRVKLAKEIGKLAKYSSLYIMDEPTTGLHFHDIAQLLKVIDKLVDNGHTVVVIEHNLDVVAYADHVIDLGPEGGEGGGQVVACGTPEEVASVATSWTGRFLAEHLE